MNLGLFPFLSCLLLGAEIARAGDAVTYWDPKGGKSVTESCERITAETTMLADGKWYYVEGNVEMTHGLALENEAHIILTDDSRLVIGDGNPATLTDIDPPTDKAFYRVEASVS